MNKIKIESVLYFNDIDLSIFIDVDRNTNLNELERLANLPSIIYLKKDEILVILDEGNKCWPSKILNAEKEKYCFSYLKDECKKNKPYLTSSDFVKSNDSITDVYNKIVGDNKDPGEIIFEPLSWAIHY